MLVIVICNIKKPSFVFQIGLKEYKETLYFFGQFGNSNHSCKAGPLTVCISQLVERSLFEDKG